MPLIKIPPKEGHNPSEVKKNTEKLQNLVGICSGFAVPHIRGVLEEDLRSSDAFDLLEIAKQNLSEILKEPGDLDSEVEKKAFENIINLTKENLHEFITMEDISKTCDEFANVLIRSWIDSLRTAVIDNEKVLLDYSLLPIDKSIKNTVIDNIMVALLPYDITESTVHKIMSDVSYSLSKELICDLPFDLKVIFPNDANDNITIMHESTFKKLAQIEESTFEELTTKWINVIACSYSNNPTYILGKNCLPNKADENKLFIKYIDELLEENMKTACTDNETHSPWNISLRRIFQSSPSSIMAEEIMRNFSKAMQNTVNDYGVLYLKVGSNAIVISREQTGVGHMVVSMPSSEQSAHSSKDTTNLICDNFKLVIDAAIIQKANKPIDYL